MIVSIDLFFEYMMSAFPVLSEGKNTVKTAFNSVMFIPG